MLHIVRISMHREMLSLELDPDIIGPLMSNAYDTTRQKTYSIQNITNFKFLVQKGMSL